jgi:hypothetical protein
MLDPKTEQLLKRAEEALTDWVRTYAPEMCDGGHVAETYEKIMRRGGTLYYIGELRADILDHLAEDKGVAHHIKADSTTVEEFRSTLRTLEENYTKIVDMTKSYPVIITFANERFVLENERDLVKLNQAIKGAIYAYEHHK